MRLDLKSSIRVHTRSAPCVDLAWLVARMQPGRGIGTDQRINAVSVDLQSPSRIFARVDCGRVWSKDGLVFERLARH